MDRKICLDSDILVDLSKNSNYVIKRLKNLDASFYITSINSFELWIGRKKEEVLKDFLNSFFILDFDNDSALLAGDIFRKLKKEGLIVDFRDIMIGAICIKNKIELMTNNKKHFQRMEDFGLKVLE